MKNLTNKQQAIFEYFGKDEDLLEEIKKYKDSTEEFEINGEAIFVLTDEEADIAFDDYLVSYLEECIYPVLPADIARYFDENAWKRDASMDGRGCLAGYDGVENEFCITGETIYIYRKN